jgi:large subunit ribosomal protein L6
VTVAITGNRVEVAGPRGKLELTLPPLISVEQDGSRLLVARKADHKQARSLHGLNNRLIANMVTGVSAGFEKKLEIIGVGYRAQMEGDDLVLQLGFSHPVRVPPPEGIVFSVEGNQLVTVSGYDKQMVGEVAARIRRHRPPEPYKGKGIRYQGEWVRRKAGKALA